MMKYILILITAAVLVYGDIVDYKRREIPNSIPIVLLIIGMVGFSTIWCIMGFAVPAVLLFTAAKITKSDVPGGDFKLLCSLGFVCGLRELAAVIFLAGIGAMIFGFIKRLPVKRRIPLCSYIAPAYIVFHATVLVLEKIIT